MNNSVDIDFDEEIMALLILCLLLESWNSLVMVVSNSDSYFSKLKFDDVVGIIPCEDMRQKTTGETSSTTLTIENKEHKGRKARV